jgi:hypothetical protein
VLVPLLELDPELRLPATEGRKLSDALAALPPGQVVRKAAPPLAL